VKTKPTIGSESVEETSPNRGQSAFSLIEVMVAIGLLTFIIVGLLMMFQQTQRAFRASMTQTDVLEGGRSLLDMISRDLEQAVPTRYPNVFPNNTTIPIVATNFFIQYANLYDPLVQELPGSTTPPQHRTNWMQRVFFTTHVNQDWFGVGYEVRFDSPTNTLIGTLYRCTTNNIPRGGPFSLSASVWTNGVSKLAEGVVHFRVIPYSANGFPLLGAAGADRRLVCRTNEFFPLGNGFPYTPVRNTTNLLSLVTPDGFSGCYFSNDAMPAAVEVEIGIIEPRVLAKFKSIPLEVPASRQFLVSRSAYVHIFRQRIPLRNADPSLFP